MQGRTDLSIAFFEVALRGLQTNGGCAFICADRWMTNQHGAGLRDLLTQHFSVETLLTMHTAEAFAQNVSAYRRSRTWSSGVPWSPLSRGTRPLLLCSTRCASDQPNLQHFPGSTCTAWKPGPAGHSPGPVLIRQRGIVRCPGAMTFSALQACLLPAARGEHMRT
jgi:hypothetical protein